MFNCLKHFIVITRHRHMVMHNCFRSGLYLQGLLHDLSKYSFAEFIPSVKNYAQGKYSPNENERQKLGYSRAWLHHKGRNKHHCEYWFDYVKEYNKYMPVKMPDRYLAESVCDRIAASKNYNRKNFNRQMVLDYFLREESHLVMHPETKDKMRFILEEYVKYGEKYTFKYLKNNMRGKK